MQIDPENSDVAQPGRLMTRSNELKKIGEFGLIAQLNRLLGHTEDELKSLGVECGIGDDAAVINLQHGEQMLLTNDIMIEGTHFIWEKIPPASLGYKLMAINLSDIAAMGGTPRFAVVSLGINDRLTLADIEATYQGMRELAQCFHTLIVGGDTVRSPLLTLGLTLIGTVPVGQAVLRSGARPEDILLVTGTPVS
ncbi:MAG: thiamine-monophosphate kinase, partial [Syntrophomonadaceae bacterium]|nr:thiamine-monophosphate kinase [Syntrophomonadaceae bacterium]